MLRFVVFILVVNVQLAWSCTHQCGPMPQRSGESNTTILQPAPQQRDSDLRNNRLEETSQRQLRNHSPLRRQSSLRQIQADVDVSCGVWLTKLLANGTHPIVAGVWDRHDRRLAQEIASPFDGRGKGTKGSNRKKCKCKSQVEQVLGRYYASVESKRDEPAADSSETTVQEADELLRQHEIASLRKRALQAMFRARRKKFDKATKDRAEQRRRLLWRRPSAPILSREQRNFHELMDEYQVGDCDCVCTIM